MPRNSLKTFPTAVLRRGLAHFHPACVSPVQPPIEPPGTQHARERERPDAPDPEPALGPVSPEAQLETPVSAA